jgi:hypothetical protein
MNESYADPVFPCINDAGLHRIIRAGASLVPKHRPPMLTVLLFVLEWMGGRFPVLSVDSLVVHIFLNKATPVQMEAVSPFNTD